MDLTAVAGIGPAYRERLQAAGIADVAALAAADDLDALRNATGIARARLEAARAEARRMLMHVDATPTRAARPEDDNLGIATEGVSHAADAAAARLATHLQHAWRDAKVIAAAKAEDARAKVAPLVRKLPAPVWARMRGA